MDEIDKFKLKLIHAVKKGPPDEALWENLKKETGRDCEFLWRRMIAITKKKLARLLAADDDRTWVPPGARMSITDWQLVDFVLVHDQTDFIGSPENPGPVSVAGPDEELRALRRLFGLVNKYQVETSSIYTRTRRWAQLALEYNKDGRECSPMLLQRRWYQMKERARTQFYEFWIQYRGNKSNLSKASSYTPRALDVDIARFYPTVVTQPFPDWEDLVKGRVVVLPELFHRLAQRCGDLRRLYKGNVFVTRESLKPAPAPSQVVDNEPDLVLVEPHIDTIELDGDSDTEAPDHQAEGDQESMDQYEESDAAVAGMLESEEQNGLSNVQIVEATHVPTEDIDDDSPSELISEVPDTAFKINVKPEAHTMEVEEERDLIETVSESDELDSLITAVVAAVNASVKPEAEAMEVDDAELLESVAESKELEDEQAGLSETLSERKELEVGQSGLLETVSGPKELESNASESHKLQSEDSPENLEAVEKVLKENLDALRKETQVESHDIDSDENDTLFTCEATTKLNFKNLVSKIKDELSEDARQEEPKEADSSLVIGELPSNLELIDDGIDFIEDSDDDMIDNSGISKEVKKEANLEKEEQPKFDLKLMMLPVVYTMKLELMKCLADSDYQNINTSDILDLIVRESKPISTTLSVNIKYEVEAPSDVNVDKNSSVDLITISEEIPEVPCPASGENESADLFKIMELDKAPSESAEVGSEDDGDSSDSSDDGIPESHRVKLTSSLFKKPKDCTYNPIQLCKNPDFNTRLRRLSAGFLTYERNRRYLNRLQPLTIDLHKSFEQKLIDKTVYLVPDPNAPAPVKDVHQHSVTASVIPTAMPAQSLLDETKNNENIEDVNIIDEELAQRKNKIIELPDIVKVRRINQHLLTAEVSPIQVINDQTTRPYLQISPLYSSTDTRSTERKLSYGASSSEVPQDDHPLLHSPKAGETTRVKVELMDDDDNDEAFAQTPANSVSNNESQHQSTENIALQVQKEEEKEVERPKKKYTPKGTKEHPKRPWYLPPLYPVHTFFDIKETNSSAKTPWYRHTQTKPLECGLLTFDTLNKMIHVIEGKDEGAPKKKSHKKAPEGPTLAPIENNDIIIDLSAAETTEPTNVKPEKPDDVPPVVETVPQKSCKTRVRNSQRPIYCCWANRVLVIKSRRNRGHSKKSWLPKHKCPKNNCTCCCRDQLAISKHPESEHLPYDLESCCWANKMIKIFKDRKKYESMPNLPDHYCVTTGNRRCKCCCKEALDTVAGVVEKICQSAKETADMTETSKAVTWISKPLTEGTLAQSEPSNTVINDGIVPFENVLQPLRSYGRLTTSTQPTLQCKETIDVELHSNEAKLANEVCVNAITRVTSEPSVTQVKLRETNIDRSTDAPRSVNTSAESDQFIVLSDDDADSISGSDVVGANYVVSPSGKLVVQAPTVRQKIVIPPPKPKFIIKCFKNLMQACPVRLGLNKILLTTAKIPTELLMPQSKQVGPRPPSPPPATPCLTNVNIPKGVHLVMEPSGKLVCAFEPNVKFEEHTMEELKNIVEIIQDQLNNKLLTVTAPPVVDTVTLSDDENADEKVAKQTNYVDQTKPDHLVTAVETTLAKNNLEYTSQTELPQDVPEKTTSEEINQVVQHIDTTPERLMDESEGRADVTLQRPVENITDDITDVTEHRALEPCDDDEMLPVQTCDSTQLVEKLSHNIADASKATEKLPEDIVNASRPSEKLSEDVADVSLPVEKLSENNADASQMVEKLSEDIADAPKSVEKLSEDIAAASQTVEKLSEDIVDASQTIVKLSEDKADASQPFEKLSEDITDVSHPVEKLSEAIPDASQAAKNLSQDMANDSQPAQKISEDTDCEKTQTFGSETEKEEMSQQEPKHQNEESIITEENEESGSPRAEGNIIHQATEAALTESGDNSQLTELEHTTEAVTQQQNQEVTTQPSILNKKSILSDLMEMSGISSEDVLPTVEQPITLVPAQPAASVLEPDAPTELTQVTNVAALKYSVAHNGKFFRYTIGTGALAAIEVALQSSRVTRPALGIGLTPVVDLTEAASPEITRVGIEKTKSGNPIVIRKVTGGTRLPFLTIGPKTTTSSRSVLKPPLIRLAERRRPGRPRKHLVEPHVVKPQVIGGEVRRKRGRPRKQLLDNTVLNLDATDGEMEEEYLLDSDPEPGSEVSMSESPLGSLLRLERKRRAAITNTAPAEDDSSEDEPLIQIVKRRKQEKKLRKRERKLAKKQLKLIQKTADIYSIVSAEVDQVSDGTGSTPESTTEGVAYAATPEGDQESIPQDGAEPVPVSAVVPESEPMSDSVAEQLANQGEAWLDPSDDDSDNFILGA